jgi:hypothetical protein
MHLLQILIHITEALEAIDDMISLARSFELSLVLFCVNKIPAFVTGFHLNFWTKY